MSRFLVLHTGFVLGGWQVCEFNFCWLLQNECGLGLTKTKKAPSKTAHYEIELHNCATVENYFTLAGQWYILIFFVNYLKTLKCECISILLHIPTFLTWVFLLLAHLGHGPYWFWFVLTRSHQKFNKSY